MRSACGEKSDCSRRGPRRLSTQAARRSSMPHTTALASCSRLHRLAEPHFVGQQAAPAQRQAPLHALLLEAVEKELGRREATWREQHGGAGGLRSAQAGPDASKPPRRCPPTGTGGPTAPAAGATGAARPLPAAPPPPAPAERAPRRPAPASRCAQAGRRGACEGRACQGEAGGCILEQSGSGSVPSARTLAAPPAALGGGWPQRWARPAAAGMHSVHSMGGWSQRVRWKELQLSAGAARMGGSEQSWPGWPCMGGAASARAPSGAPSLHRTVAAGSTCREAEEEDEGRRNGNEQARARRPNAQTPTERLQRAVKRTAHALQQPLKRTTSSGPGPTSAPTPPCVGFRCWGRCVDGSLMGGSSSGGRRGAGGQCAAAAAERSPVALMKAPSHSPDVLPESLGVLCSEQAQPLAAPPTLLIQ